MNDLLIELLSEEIPSRFQEDAIQQFRSLLEDGLKSEGFDISDIDAGITPRRMYFLAKVSEMSRAITTEKRGPLASAPEEAIRCFLKANSISREECEERNVNGKQYLFAHLNTEAKPLKTTLQNIINNVINKMKWNKSMHWETPYFSWARPLRGIVCMYDQDVINVEIDKIGLQSSNKTRGHRVIGENIITIQSAQSYKQQMAKNGIILSQSERRQAILQEFERIEASYNIIINKDENLLDEVVGLVEHPKAFVGEISDEYMILPEDVLRVTMRVHQRYFITKTHDNKISKYFVFISNIDTTDNGKTVIHGNQRVLSARLCDAKFFFENDLKRHLSGYSEELKKTTFYEGLGSVFDRMHRIKQITQDLSKLATEPSMLQRAADLCKCDLKTSIVSEFPEVQGVYGGHMALVQGESQYVAQAISEQYLPAGNDIPKTNGGSLLSIADKIDLLVSFFAVGKAPNGSKDPFGLRRAAIGILKIIIENKLDIDNLNEIIKNAFECLQKQNGSTKLDNDTPVKVIEFLKNRFTVIAKSYNLRYFELFIDKGNFLTTFEESIRFENTGNAEKMLEVFKRAYSIGHSDDEKNGINVCLFKTQQENELYSTLTKANCKFEDLYEKSIAFFDNVLINTDESEIKANRLALIHELLIYFYRIGDFQKLI